MSDFFVFSQLLKFAAVGASNTIITFGICQLLLQFNLHYVLSYTIGFIAGMVNSFLLNKRFVFKLSNNSKKENIITFIKMCICYSAIGIGLGNFLLVLLVSKKMLSEFLAPIAVIIITLPINFTLNKYWSFKN